MKISDIPVPQHRTLNPEDLKSLPISSIFDIVYAQAREDLAANGILFEPTTTHNTAFRKLVESGLYGRNAAEVLVRLVDAAIIQIKKEKVLL